MLITSLPLFWFPMRMQRQRKRGKMINQNSRRTKEKQRKVMRRNVKRHRQQKVGVFWEGELSVAMATTGTLVQSPRQCLVARERFGQREKAARQAAAFFLHRLCGIWDRWQGLFLHLSCSSITLQRDFYTPCLLSVSVCVSSPHSIKGLFEG